MTVFPFSARLLASLGLSLLGAGCGGGGGDSSGSATPAPAAPATTFPVAAAMTAYLKQSGSQAVTGSGTISGQTGTGSGTVTISPGVNTTFEGTPAVQQQVSSSLVVQNGNGSASLNSTSLAYYDIAYTLVLGASSSGAYSVSTTRNALPASAAAGASGTWYVTTDYTSSLKTNRAGTTTATYSLQAETGSATTAILSVVITSTPTTGASATATDTYRIPAAGAAVHLQQVVSAPSQSTTVTYSK